ncbi:MAG: hypothetical protein KBD94_06500 [Pyrinomonadaceae bacterium]|nr:hypothetical protein [Pyrinomonadaceae bacterium]
MARFVTNHYLVALGVLIGIGYGLITRLIWGQQMALASLTYLFLIPTVLGVIPLIFANEAQVRSYLYIIFIPWLTVLSFFLTMWILRIESLICLIILGAPFFVLGTIGALIFRLVLLHQKAKKNVLPAIAFMMLPVLLAPVENAVNSPSQVYAVTSEVVIDARPDNVWKNIVRVPEISEGEYRSGVFHSLGIPRPIEAELIAEGPGAMRKGHFEGGLTFTEHIIDWQPHRKVAFDIVVDPDTIAERVFDQHVLKGNYFTFIDAGYEIESINETQVRLRLTSQYRLTSKVNFYGKFWGDIILADFQDRLLDVIKRRCDRV